jgi:hypothetical protein
MNFKFLLAFVAASTVASLSVAQPRIVERTATAKAGQPTQIGIFGRVKPDCTSGPVVIRVIDHPDHGKMSERSAKLKTDKIARCPPIETSVAVIFYQPNAGFLGRDELIIEAETDTGQIERYHYKIDVE